MVRLLILALLAAAPAALAAAVAGPEASPLLQKPWYELNSGNFRVFSCAQTQEVVKLITRLENFRACYSSLAGTQAVVSPPVVVMVFPDQLSMRPYLPVYNGTPGNLTGFFKRGSDENWIVISLASASQGSLNVIYHEYAHLLLRRNDRIWPLWLKEGMADLYSTFQLTGRRGRIAGAKPGYIALLRREGLMPLHELMSVTRESADYNEQQRQGRFYAQSWLLTHYLVAGDNVVLKSRFPSYTARLKNGEEPLEALTRALGVTAAALENGLQQYLMRPALDHIELLLDREVPAPTAALARPLSKAEAAVRLGNQLLRVQQVDKAEAYFQYARTLAPASPLPFEGLGILASASDKPPQALENLERAIELKSASFLTHYLYGREKLRTSNVPGKGYTRLEPKTAATIREALQQSIRLMPSFGPAHHLLGTLEAIQGEVIIAEQHVRKALEFEPDNAMFLMTLAQIQLERSNPAGARESLRPLLHPSVDDDLRERARVMLKKLG